MSNEITVTVIYNMAYNIQSGVEFQLSIVDENSSTQHFIVLVVNYDISNTTVLEIP